jgi:hypothetical protein
MVAMRPEEAIARQLSGVTYHQIFLDDRFFECGDADVVSMEIDLVFDSCEIVKFRWLMIGFDERLAVGEGEPSEPKPDMVVLDASGRWTSVVGSILEAVVWVEDETMAGMSPWACRMSFSNGRSLVIALGQCEEGRLVYIPDSLAIMDSEDLAKSYRGPQSSAWGPED